MGIISVLGILTKLLSWHLVGRKLRWGFLVAILGNALLGCEAYEVGAFSVVLYFFLVSIVQLKSFLEWTDENK